MTKQKYRMTFKCSEPECVSVFEKITTNKDLMNPRCPYCKERKRDATKLHRVGDGAITDEELALIKLIRSKDFENDPAYLAKALGKIPQSSSLLNKAKDETANIVMQDYKQGNITDRAQQPGEVMAPRLDPVRQNMADGMFGGKKKGFNTCLDLGSGRARSIGNGGINMGAMARQAMSGAYRSGIDPVAAAQGKKEPLRINYVNKGN